MNVWGLGGLGTNPPTFGGRVEWLQETERVKPSCFPAYAGARVPGLGPGCLLADLPKVYSRVHVCNNLMQYWSYTVPATWLVASIGFVSSH